MKPAIASSCTTRPYTPSSLSPIWITATFGFLSLIYFFSQVGLDVLRRPYLWPSLLLTPFFVYCAISRQFAPWHRWFWRFAQIWSAFWTISFLLLLPSLLGLLVFVPVIYWCMSLNINPWVALGLHLLFFSCCSDILRQEKSLNG